MCASGSTDVAIPAESDEYIELMKNAKPFWLSRIFVRFYWLISLVALVIQIASVVLTIKFSLFQTVNLTDRDFFSVGDQRTTNYDIQQALSKQMQADLLVDQ